MPPTTQATAPQPQPRNIRTQRSDKPTDLSQGDLAPGGAGVGQKRSAQGADEIVVCHLALVEASRQYW